MQKIFFILISMFNVCAYGSDVSYEQNDINVGETSPQLVEVVLKLPFENLIIHSEGISVNYKGALLPIRSLKNDGDLWTAKAIIPKYQAWICKDKSCLHANPSWNINCSRCGAKAPNWKDK